MDTPLEATGAAEEVACHDCAQVQSLPQLGLHSLARCCRCDAVLDRREPPDSTPLALALAGLLCGLLANAFPIVEVSLAGRHRSNLLVGGPRALVSDHMPALALVVAFFSIVFPLLWLGAVCYVLFHVRRGNRARELGPLFRLAERLRPWGMIEVYVMGGFVAFTRLEELGRVSIGTGGWAVAAMAFLTFLVDQALDRRHVWDSIQAPRPVSPGPTLACPQCDLVTGLSEGARCPRCRTPLRRRKPDSLDRTVALVIAGAALYLPANILPIMAVGRLGRPNPNTILTGIGELVRRGYWPLALIVLFASVLVPVLKLVSLTWFVVSVRQRWRWALRFRTRLYRWVDAIGRWSNIDIFMISLLVALVQFGVLATVEAKAGAVAFAAVVVVTMFAAEAFDPRLMWDAVERRTG
ncbi:MAG TPA: PqiA/YebS family transporter subunit [Myxococcaceae bacterium]|nr:PqiA/YebS family transporter subunit [Myxococcaceae bacterium]